MSGAPAGIYDDPSEPGRQRYWDGSAWGAQLPVAPGPGGAPSPHVSYGDVQPRPAPQPSWGTPGSSGTYASHHSPGGFSHAAGWVAPETHNLLTATRACLTKYADFSGRASRSEFWYFALFLVILEFAAGFAGGLFGALSGMSDTSIGTAVDSISLLITLATLLPSLAVSWRRMHDTDRSGVYALIPIYGWFIIPMFRGTPGPNSWG
jgi:uncharacterized membrane protein YhaH (DUF805 family)